MKSPLTIVLFTLLATSARADEGLPPIPGSHDEGGTGDRPRSWEMPALKTELEPPAVLREEERIGPNKQPRWTATRRFTTTRAYVVPEGKVEVELWARVTTEGDETKLRFLQEIEFGLPGRLQFDAYFRQDMAADAIEDAGVAAMLELRWALADWGKIPGNPALYLEYILKDGSPDVIEPKLLLSGEISTGWHWASNFVLEHELSGEYERELGWTVGLSKTIIDMTLSLGIETDLRAVDVRGQRGDWDFDFFVGPSIQFRPIPQLTVNLLPMYEVLESGPEGRLWINLGWEI